MIQLTNRMLWNVSSASVRRILTVLKMSWSRDAICALIDNYKKHTCLYVVRSPFYHNKDARQKALQAIANDLAPWRPTTALEVKAKFNNLRTAFLTEKKLSENSKPAGPLKYVPNLWYYDRIKYIEEHIVRRGSRTNSLYDEFEMLQNSNQVTQAQSYYIRCPNPDPDDGAAATTDTVVSFKRVKVEPETDDVISVSSSEPHPTPTDPEYWTSNDTQDSEVDPLQEFGNFVVSRLRRIQNTDILLKLEHDIQLKIMEAELKETLASGDSQ